MAHEHDRPVGHHGLDDLQQVAAELLDRGVLAVGPARAAVRALVEVDAAHEAAVGRALEVPAVELEAEAVHEDQRHRRGVGVGPVELVDLDVQGHAVVGDHGDRGRVQRPQGHVASGGRVDAPLLAHHAHGGAGRGDAEGTTDGSDDPAAGAHAGASPSVLAVPPVLAGSTASVST